MREHRGRAGNEQWKLELLGVAVHSFARLRGGWLRRRRLKVEGRKATSRVRPPQGSDPGRRKVEGRSKVVSASNYTPVPISTRSDPTPEGQDSLISLGLIIIPGINE